MSKDNNDQAEGIEAVVAAAVAEALKNVSQTTTAASQVQAAAQEEALREQTRKRIQAENKKKSLYSNPVCEILVECKVVGNHVFPGDKVGTNAGVTPRDINALVEYKQAKRL